MSIQWRWPQFFIVIFMATTLTTAIVLSVWNSRHSPPAQLDRNVGWYEGGGPSAAYELSPGHNFYETIADIYPDVGIVTHSIDSRTWSPVVEHRAISAAIAICRQHFKEAYLKSNIEIGLSDETKLRMEANGHSEFRLKYVVILIRNHADFLPPNADGTRESLPFEEWTKPIKVGYLFPAELIFSNSKDNNHIISQGVRDEHPVHFVRDARIPAHEMVLDIVSSFKKRR